MNREIPIITDNLAQPEFGTGAVKVTPAHDPNDFEAGLRHNLPQIEVIDDQARMNENAGPYAGLDRYEARKRVLEDLREQGFLVGEKDYTIAIGKCDRCGTVVEPRLSTQWFVKIAPLAQPRNRGRRAGRNHDRSGELQTDLSELDAQHLRLVHLAATVVGTPNSGVALLVRRNYCCSRNAEELYEVRRVRP